MQISITHLLCLSTLLFPMACPGSSDEDQTQSTLLPSLQSDGMRLLNQDGQEVVLRGINARINGLFDVTFDDGRIPLETIPEFGEEDYLVLKNELGFNALRIPINWSGLEPLEGGILDDDYLSVLDSHLALCEKHQLWCVVDVHQDAYSKEIGEDGAPLWAILPPPTELLEGPLDNLYERRGSEQVLAAFKTFFDGTDGIQDAYISMLTRLASHLKDRPYVAGIEIFNEPVADTLEVLQFSAKAIDAIREIDENQLVLFEPTSTRNLFDETDPLDGLNLPNTAYAPHLYPEVFSGEGNSFVNGNPERLISSTAKAKDEAEVHQAPLIVTEYGIDPAAANAELWIKTMDDEMDKALSSRFYWVYEEHEQDKWGLYDDGKVLREHVANWLARPYPDAISGVLQSFRYNEVEQSFEVQFTGGGTHHLALPYRTMGQSPIGYCDGEAITLQGDGPVYSMTCGEASSQNEHALRIESGNSI